MLELFQAAQRFIGTKELSEKGKDHPLIQYCLSLCGFGLDAADEVPWCSAFVNFLCFIQGKPRTKSAAARSWLAIGVPMNAASTQIGDIVILKRGEGEQPGPEVLDAPGHVGLFAGWENDSVLLLAGNQGNQVSVARFKSVRILGIRRLV